MNPIQKWQNGLPLTDYDKQVIKQFGYNPDEPYNALQGTSPLPTPPLQGSSPNLQGSSPILQGSVPNLQIGSNPQKQAPLPKNLPNAFASVPQAPAAPVAPAAPITGASGTGTGSSAYTPQLVEYPPGSGFYYDLNNNTERSSFFNARATDLAKERDTQLADIQQQIADLQTKAKGYVDNYHSQLQDLTGTKGAGDLSRINAFSAASPNAFQSSEGDSYTLANNNYLQGIGDAALQANEAVGTNFLGDPNDPSQLTADTTYGRGLAGLNSGINDVGTQYNEQLAGLNQQSNPSTDPFRFDRKANNIASPNPIDLSAFKPFVGFTNVPASAAPGGSFVPNTPNLFNANTPLDNYLGGTNISGSDKDFLRNYLLGKSS